MSTIGVSLVVSVCHDSIFGRRSVCQSFLRSRAAPTPPKSHVSAGLAHATAQANRGKPARHCEAHSPAGERHGGRASRGRGRHGNEGPGGATAGDDRKMNNEPLEREPIDRMRARLEALLKANAAPRCGARSKRTGKPCLGAAMPNGRCKFHGGKSTGPRTPEGLERSRRANWKHGHFSREAKAERSRLREALLTLRDLCDSI